MAAARDETNLAVLDIDRGDAGDGAVLIDDEVDDVPLVEKHGVVFQIALVERVQQGVAGAVGRGAGSRRLPTLAEILRLAAEGPLVDSAIGGAGEGQAHVFEFIDGLRAFHAQVFDGVLVADVVGAFDGVVHVPAPIVLGVGAGDGAGDSTLGRHGVGTGGEDFRQHRGAETGLG